MTPFDSLPKPIVRVPRGFFFPVNPIGPVRLDVDTLDGDNFQLLVGGVAPLGGELNRKYPALSLKHFRMMVRMLTNQKFESPEVAVCFEKLWPGGGARRVRDMRNTLDELTQAWVHRIRRGKNGTIDVVAERLMTLDVKIDYAEGVDPADPTSIGREDAIKFRWLRRVKFNADLWRAFVNWAGCWQVRADVVDSILSDTACGAYLWLGPQSFARGISADHPGRKDAADLLRQLGLKVPARLAELRRVFERARGGATSVLDQLDGRALAKGHLRVNRKLEPNAAGDGFNIIFWREQQEHSADLSGKSRGALFEVCVAAGLTPDQFDEAQHPEWRAIEGYEQDRINELNYSVQANRGYLELVRSIVGPVEFASVIGSAHLAKNEGEAKDMNKFFGGALRNAVRAKAERLHAKLAAN